MPELFADRYEILAKIGQGGMGVVYKAHDTKLDRIVALKGIRPTGPEDVARFQREARIAAKLNHPNIVPVHDVEIDGEQCFLTMEFVEGRNLGEEQLPAREAVEIVLQVAEGLNHAHEGGVIHRDVKPANILIDDRGRVRLTDFGLARPVEGTKLSRSGAVMGTPAYMSPEQARGDDVDARSDLYSLGVTLYQLVSGRQPFEGATLHELIVKIAQETPRPPMNVAPDVATIIMKCLEKEPARRYASVRAFAQDLRAWLDGRPIAARPPSVLYRLKHVVLRRRAILITALASVTAALLLLTPLVLQYRRDIALRNRLKPLEDAVRDARPFLYIAGYPTLRAKQDRVRDALELLEREPGRTGEVWTSIGIARQFIGDDDGAERAFRKAFELEENDPIAVRELGRLLLDRSFLLLVTGPDPKRRTQLAADAARDALRFLSRTKADGTDLEIQLASAWRARAEGDVGRTETLCREGLYRFGDAIGAEDFWLLLGTILPHGAALEALTKVLDRRPHHATASFLRAPHREAAGDLDGAILDAETALRLKPRYAPAHSNVGFYRWAKGDIDGARADLDEAIRLDPLLAGAWANRADVKRLQGDAAGAEADARQALKIYPEFAHAHASLAGALLVRKDLDGAARELDRALQLDPALDAAIYVRGNLRLRRGDFAGAIQDLEAVLPRLPAVRRPPVVQDLADGYSSRAGSAVTAGNADAAMADADRALKLAPRHAAALRNRAGAHRLKGRLREALLDYDAAIAIDAVAPKAWADRGATKRLLGDLDGAMADYSHALRLDPGHAEAFYGRGLVHLGREQFDDAIREFSDALRARPAYAEALVNRGTAHGRKGDRAAHKADFEQALKVAPADWPYRAQIEQAVKTLGP